MGYRPECPIYMGGEKVNTPAAEFELRVTDAAKVAAVAQTLQPM